MTVFMSPTLRVWNLWFFGLLLGRMAEVDAFTWLAFASLAVLTVSLGLGLVVPLVKLLAGSDEPEILFKQTNRFVFGSVAGPTHHINHVCEAVLRLA